MKTHTPTPCYIGSDDRPLTHPICLTCGMPIHVNKDMRWQHSLDVDQSNDVFIDDEMDTTIITEPGYCEPCQGYYEYPNHTH